MSIHGQKARANKVRPLKLKFFLSEHFRDGNVLEKAFPSSDVIRSESTPHEVAFRLLPANLHTYAVLQV